MIARPSSKLHLVLLLCLVQLGVGGACSSQAARAGSERMSASVHSSVSDPSGWPKTATAVRKFQLEAVFADMRSRPWKLWMVSHPDKGQREAMEFFTGERVTNVQAEAVDGSSATLSYSFTDAKGRRYSSVRADSSRVDMSQPSVYAGWQGNGYSHDVVLGSYLFDTHGTTDQNGIYTAKPVPVDPNTFFNGQRACEPMAYVARIQGAQSQDADPGFVPKAKIIAAYDDSKACWSTQPLHALDLQDNTFLVVVAGRVFRIRSFDLMPTRRAPDLKLIDIKEK